MLRKIPPSNKAVPVGYVRDSMPGGEKMFNIFGELNDGTDRATIIGGSLVELRMEFLERWFRAIFFRLVSPQKRLLITGTKYSLCSDLPCGASDVSPRLGQRLDDGRTCADRNPVAN